MNIKNEIKSITKIIGTDSIKQDNIDLCYRVFINEFGKVETEQYLFNVETKEVISKSKIDIQRFKTNYDSVTVVLPIIEETNLFYHKEKETE